MANRITRTQGKYEWSWTQTFEAGLFVIKCAACKVEVRRIDVQQDAVQRTADKLMTDHICKPTKPTKR